MTDTDLVNYSLQLLSSGENMEVDDIQIEKVCGRKGNLQKGETCMNREKQTCTVDIKEPQLQDNQMANSEPGNHSVQILNSGDDWQSSAITGDVPP
jgi:hypothetical protein